MQVGAQRKRSGGEVGAFLRSGSLGLPWRTDAAVGTLKKEDGELFLGDWMDLKLGQAQRRHCGSFRLRFIVSSLSTPSESPTASRPGHATRW